MAAFLHLKPGAVHVDPADPLLRAHDYSAMAEAAEILADARSKRDAMLSEAKVAYEREKQQGREDGLAEAQAEIAEQILTIVTRSVDYLATAEGEVARTVLLCVRKILGDFPEEDLVIREARSALASVRAEPRVTLRVRSALEASLRGRVGEILADSTDVGFIEVRGDDQMAHGGCRLETEAGVVDASLETQLAALEKVILSRVSDTTKAEG
ncbi:MAG: HrpE/YscL family type III secretion apparatus protein [Pseudomonadota bacterium]